MSILFICLIALISTNLQANSKDYDFKIGYWSIEAKTMNPDQSHSTGSGTGHVYRNEVGIIQDNLCINMEGVPDVIGTTLRTFNDKNKIWHVSWTPYGTSSGSGIGSAKMINDKIVESFTGEDSHGAYIDHMNFTFHSADHYEANLSRTYQNGHYKIDCIWCYTAKRIKSSNNIKCDQIK